MRDLFDDLPAEERRKLRRRSFPGWMAPMLATLTDEPFSDPGWVYEPKLDGIRLLVFRKGNEVRLFSRNRKERSASYPEVAAAFARMQSGARDFVVDGEVVAFEGKVTSFARLQKRMETRVAVLYYAFDILYVAGHDVTRLPLRRRKALLKSALTFAGPVRFTAHRNRDGERYYREACREGLEGVMAKLADSPYVHQRSRDWLKLKCAQEQEVVIGGFTDPQGSRRGFGALLMGTYDDGALRYAGKVGTGFDDATLTRLRAKLDRIERATSPFAPDEDVPSRGVHWVSPRLVAQVAFMEWTSDGRLRHSRFLGLRDDKDPKAVVRERPQRRSRGRG